jgi:hypothetical protein
MSLMTGRRAVVASKSGDTLSRRMWGRRPGRPDGWHAILREFAFTGGLPGAPSHLPGGTAPVPLGARLIPRGTGDRGVSGRGVGDSP